MKNCEPTETNRLNVSPRPTARVPFHRLPRELPWGDQGSVEPTLAPSWPIPAQLLVSLVLTIGVGPRVRHCQDASSHKPQIGVNFVFTMAAARQ